MVHQQGVRFGRREKEAGYRRSSIRIMTSYTVLVEYDLDIVRIRQELPADFTVRCREGGNINVKPRCLESVRLRGRQRSGRIRDRPRAAAHGCFCESNDKSAVA